MAAAPAPCGPAAALPWTVGLSGLTVRLRVTPRGGADVIEGTATLADGRPVVLARVRALPAEGAANAAVEALVARATGAPKRAARVTAGKTQRTKTVEIDGDGTALAAALAATLATAGTGRRKGAER